MSTKLSLEFGYFVQSLQSLLNLSQLQSASVAIYKPIVTRLCDLIMPARHLTRYSL